MDVESPNDELAWKVDNETRPPVERQVSASGYRKYLWTSRRSQQHEETLLRFWEGIQRRWSDTRPSERDKPFPYPPTECGYSVNSHVRIAQHWHRHSSNYVMNLTEDICAYLHKSKKICDLVV